MRPVRVGLLLAALALGRTVLKGPRVPLLLELPPYRRPALRSLLRLVGERARAFLRDAEILVLDEATSQIDVESERLIHEALASYVENRTVIMITHRASTLELADTILQVDHGKVTKRPARQFAAA